MHPVAQCDECGAAVPVDSPRGLCGRCLLELGLVQAAGRPEGSESAKPGTVGPAPEDDTEGGSGATPPPEAANHLESTARATPPTEQPGNRIGRYRLLEELGRGGCGVVYLAEQEEPVRRRVALKVIKLGMDTREVIARFAAERQALALMDHPNIARVLDAGATAAGRPYFVMERVCGLPITDFCDRHQLPTGERLKLFVQVCQAIQHAHQKGIIHRDIKPSNILVTLHDGVPVPKVIDFGIAKATQGRLTDQTLFTAFEQFLGTPAYMSPEQAELSGLDIDTRSDLYSLGVLVYELLVGATPFATKELAAAGFEQMRRTIREREPIRPSTRLSIMQAGELETAARHRRTDAPRLVHLVRGDLDWIVMKCLEKDRSRRYETASGLARDIERHLNHEPVLARPPSTTYRFQTFVRRNKVLVTAAGVVAVALVLGVLASTREALRANRAERAQGLLVTQARQQAREARLRAYASEVSVALQAWEAGNPSRARALLERQRPTPGEEDLRGFEWRYLHGLFRKREVATLPVPDGGVEVWSTAWSPDGRQVAMGGLFGRVEVWDWAARERMATIPAQGMVVYSLAFLRDGRTLVCPYALDNDTPHQVGVALWDVATRQLTGHFTTAAGGVPLIAVGHQGRLLAYVTVNAYQVLFQGRIVVCDLTKRNASFELDGHQASPMHPDFSRDDRWLATPHSDGTVILWDLEQRREWKRLTGHRGIVFMARFSPDGRTLATGGIDGTVRLWDLRDPSGPVRFSILGNHHSTVFGLDFSPDGRLLVSASLDHTAKVWDVEAGREVETLRGHDQRVASASFSPDGRFILTGSEDGTAKIWRAPEPGSDEPLDRRPQEKYRALDFSSDSRWLLAGEETQTKVWEVAARAKFTLDLAQGRFSPDAKTLAGLDMNGRPAIWDVSGRQPRRVTTLTHLPSFRSDLDLGFSPDGRMLAGVNTNGQVILSVLSGEVPGPFRLLTDTTATGGPQFSPDGEILAFRSQSNIVALWNWREGRPLTKNPEVTAPAEVRSYEFLPQGRMLVTKHPSTSVFWDHTIRLWETGGWHLTEEIPDELHAFSMDGRWMATGSGFRTRITLRDRSLGTSEELPSGSGPVDCLAFSPDGRTLAVATRDGWINLWHLPSRQEILSLKAHRSHAWRAVFSPDGRNLATAGADGTLRLWTAPTFEETDAGAGLSGAPADLP